MFFAVQRIHLGRAGRDEENADVVGGNPLFHRLFFGEFRRDLGGRVHVEQMVFEFMVAQIDQLRDRGAGRTDHGPGKRMLLHEFFGAVGDQLRRQPHFEHVVEPQRQKPLDDVVGIVEVVELPEQRGRGQRDLVVVTGNEIETVVHRPFGAALAAAHAFAAVDALFV